MFKKSIHFRLDSMAEACVRQTLGWDKISDKPRVFVGYLYRTGRQRPIQH